MLPTINILNREVSMYAIMIIIGILVGGTVAIKYFAKFHKDVSKEDLIYASIYGVIGLVVGGKILYIVTILPFLIENFHVLNWEYTIHQIFSGGFVFYGGLLGAILGMYIYCKQFKISFNSVISVIAPVVPLVHAFGRIGCLCAGCCYGIEYHGFGSIVFHNSQYTPNEIPLFPTQIVEAIFNFVIFIVLLLTYKKYLKTYKTIGLYCILYSALRFSLEFFRGDVDRGIFFNLATSQWISILIFIAGIGIFVFENKRKNKIEKETIEEKENKEEKIEAKGE